MSYITPAELRSKSAPLVDVVDDDLEALVAEFEELAERYRGVAFEPRTAVDQLEGTGIATLVLDRPRVTAVASITADGEAFTDETVLLLDAGVVRLRSGVWCRDVLYEVTYTHGYPAPPSRLVGACGEWCRATWLARQSKKPRNTISYSDPDGYTYRESTPDWAAGRPTGFVDVDAALNSLPDYRTPGVA